YFIPVRMGVRPIASLGISGAQLSRQTVEALGRLVAIAIERARAVEQLGQTEAERQGERLKSALLDSITHDFRTPLTSMKAAVTGLLTSSNLGSAQVRADLERAKEALVQLIENANLYSPKEEPITITAELTGEAVTISVADRGPGIDDFEQTMIFDKFYRGKDQRYLVRGTGMGLPIAKAIIEAQKGSISVTSQLGHGSVFSFT